MASTAIPKNPRSRFAAGIFPAQMDDAAIAPLLSRAHLLKTRGQWDEAVAVCTDAVRRSPSSPSPYALLGDIYHTQSKSDDALHWYRMALERNPNLPGVAEKYDTLLSDKRATATGNFAAATLAADRTARLPAPNRAALSATLAPSPNRVTGGRTIEWLDRVFPPGRSEGMTRLLLAVGAAIGLIVIATGIFLFIAFNKPTDDAPDAAVSVLPRPTQESVRSLPAITSSIPEPSAGIATPTPTLLDRLQTRENAGYSVTAAQANLKRGQLQIEIALAFLPGESANATRSRVLQTCAAAALAASGAEPTAQRFLVRAILQTGGVSGTTKEANGSLVFVGETSAVAINTLRTTAPVPDNGLLSASFTNVWWANGLRPTAP